MFAFKQYVLLFANQTADPSHDMYYVATKQSALKIHQYYLNWSLVGN